MNSRYRIYTEDINREFVCRLADECFPGGCTITHGTGLWRGTRENSLIVEIIGDDLWEAVQRFADIVRIHNSQQVVLATVEQNIETHLL